MPSDTSDQKDIPDIKEKDVATPSKEQISDSGRRAMQGGWDESSKEVNKTLFESYHPQEGTGKLVAGDKYPEVSVHANGDVIGPYDQVRTMYSDAGLTSKGGQEPYMEAHHLLHESIIKDHGLDSSKAPSVGLYSDEHRGPAGHPFGTQPRSHDLIVNAEDALDNYEDQGHRRWSGALKGYLKENEAHIRSKYSSDDVERLDSLFKRVSS